MSTCITLLTYNSDATIAEWMLGCRILLSKDIGRKQFALTTKSTAGFSGLGSVERTTVKPTEQTSHDFTFRKRKSNRDQWDSSSTDYTFPQAFGEPEKTYITYNTNVYWKVPRISQSRTFHHKTSFDRSKKIVITSITYFIHTLPSHFFKQRERKKSNLLLEFYYWKFCKFPLMSGGGKVFGKRTRPEVYFSLWKVKKNLLDG